MTVSVPVVARAMAALLFVTLSACEGGDTATSETGLTEDEFIAVIVELREAERAVMEEDSAQQLFAARKTEILERHQTSEEEIRAFVQTSTRDLQALSDMWEEISVRLRRAPPGDSLP